MINKIIFLIFFIMFLPINAFAYQIFSNTFYSYDTDKNKIISQDLGYGAFHDYALDYGLLIGNKGFENDQSQRMAFLFDKRFTDIGIYGDLGISSIGPTITGDLNAVYGFNYGQILLQYEIDLVDSISGIDNELYFQNIYLNCELNFNKKFYLSGLAGIIDYSDNNYRKWGKVIGVLPIINNYNIMGIYEEYEFNNFSIHYFSPSEYSRLLYGLSTYHPLTNNLNINTNLLYGYQKVIDERKNSYYIMIRGNYTTKIENLSFSAELIFDQKQPEYRYDQYLLTIIYKF